MVAPKFLTGLFTRGEGPSDANRTPTNDGANIELPDGSMVGQVGTVMQKWVDDFGGTALDASQVGWDVYDGGTYSGAGPVSPVNGVALNLLNGSGITGITYAVANSVLTVTLPTTSNAELWMVSKQMFTNPVDFYLTMKLSQRIVNNTMYFEFVECDPVTGQLVPHATVAGEVRNRGGILLPSSPTAGSASIEATCDDSAAANNINTAVIGLTVDADLLFELRPQDMVLSGVASDTIGAKSSTSLRLSRQVPDPNRAYKLRFRFKNVGAPASVTTVTLYRALVCDVQEIIAEISSGRGDSVAGKGIAVNLAPSSVVAIAAGAANIGAVQDVPISYVGSSATPTKVVSAAAVYSALLLTGGNRRLVNGALFNSGAGPIFVKFFNKATAPTIGTDTPIATFQVPAGGEFRVRDHVGSGGLYAGTLGLGIGITGAVGDLDTTALAANQVVGTLWAI